MADQRDYMILKSLKFLNNNLQAFEPGESAAHREIAGELKSLKRRLSNLTPDPEEAPAQEVVEHVVIGRRRTSTGKAQPISVIVTERVDAILANFDHGPMMEADVLAVLRGQATPATKSHAETEDYSLGLLCLRYPRGFMESYKKALGKASLATHHAFGHYQVAKQRSSVMDQVADPEQRIQERHYHLHSLSGDMQAGCWALHVMQQIEALKFAMDWARLSGKGSALVKRCFYQDVFCAQENIKYLVEGLAEQERIEMLDKDGELGAMFTQWKRTNERVVTGRNRLLTMYNIFGAAVLIDPLWSVETLGIKCSRTFGHVLEEIAARMTNNPQPFLDQQRRGRDVFVRVANAVEPNENFMSYVVDFVSTNAPKRAPT